MMPDNWPDKGTQTLDALDDDDDLANVEVGEYRGRGRPRKAPGERRREKLIISFTIDEMRQIMLKAASELPRPLDANEWARRELLRIAASKDQDPEK